MVNTGACMRIQWTSDFSVSSSILSACLANLHGRLWKGKGVIFGVQGEGTIPLLTCPSRSRARQMPPSPCPFNACHAAGLSLRLRVRGCPVATYPLSMTSAIFVRHKRRMRPKELPGCSVPHLLTAYTWQLEILVTVLIQATALRDYQQPSSD